VSRLRGRLFKRYAPSLERVLGRVRFLQNEILGDDGLSLLLSDFRLRLQPIVYFVPLSSALFVQCVGTKANLLLKVERRFGHFCWCLRWNSCGARMFHGLTDFDTLIWPPNDHLNWPPEDKAI